MNDGHLTDEMLQELIWETESADESAKEHLSLCKHCKIRAENYRLLFIETEQLPKPVFNFDLSKLVIDHLMEQSHETNIVSIPVPVPMPAVEEVHDVKQKNIWPWIILSFMALGLIGTPAYLLRDSLQGIVSGLSVMVLYLIIITIVLIAVFLVFEEYRKYNKQINTLDF